ncbi:ABC-type multidrug transport system fused ATPase/permease subunit [Peribacillus sp. V2I11]|nr:ABC-type multidrug transport system fused ATPase/permease subunit [Peribacillus sp. V2I11]
MMFGDIANYNARIENNISGIRVVQSFTKEAHEIQPFDRSNSEFRLTKLLTNKIMAWSTSMNFILMKLVALTVLVCGAWYVIHGKMTYEEFHHAIQYLHGTNQTNQLNFGNLAQGLCRV